MGQVYQATDTKLNRQVALKILPEAFATDPDRLARFQREAQVLASLNHPNIAAIYGIEEAEGTRALVLELVEGPTLADRIAQGPIPVDEALPIAKQIAEALEAAHEQGVIHRDLKPANIKVKDDGTVKVLDFGLAKALDTTPEGDPSQSPTLTAAATQMGMIIGTAAYMSPEQARGRPVDRRADIWALGAVLYEMLSGRRAFEGKDVSLTLSAVLQREPEWDTLPSDMPLGLNTYLRRCLHKDPLQRVQAAGDVRLAMEGAFETMVVAPPPVQAVAQRAAWRQTLPLVLGISTIAVVITGLATWYLTRPESPRVVRFTVSPDEAMPLVIVVQSPDVAISSDGERIAYLDGDTGQGAEQLRVRSLGQLTSETLVSEGNLHGPFFSSDGESVGFWDGRGVAALKRVSVQGGPASTICELPMALRGASWGADGTIVFATAGSSSGLWQVPAVGGEPEQLTTPDPEQGELDHIWPELLPGGEAVLFTIRASSIVDSQIAVLSPVTGEQKVVVRGGSYPQLSSTGHLLYGRQGTLWAVGFDLDRLETVGDPVPVQEGVLTKPLGAADYSVSANGSLVYVSGGAGGLFSLVWVDRQGREEPFPSLEPGDYAHPRLSPAGDRLAVELTGADGRDIWVYDLAREVFTQLTFETADDTHPVWTPDGQRIVFASRRDDGPGLFSVAADGSGTVERLTEGGIGRQPYSWSADGETLVLTEGEPDAISILPMEGDSQVEPLLQTPFPTEYPRVSPDGRWIAYTGNEPIGDRVYVRPFPDVDAGRWPISAGIGDDPVWGPDNEIFYTASGGAIMAVTIETDPTFQVGAPQQLFAGPYPEGGGVQYDVTPDGQRFVMLKRAEAETDTGQPEITVVFNWDQELAELVPVP